jgi:hypothetical protein
MSLLTTIFVNERLVGHLEKRNAFDETKHRRYERPAEHQVEHAAEWSAEIKAMHAESSKKKREEPRRCAT